MTLSADIQVQRVGAEGPEPIAAPVKAAAQLYCGSIATLRSGYLIAATSPASTDVTCGIVGFPTGGTYVKTGPGILGGSTDGAVWVDCLTGVFLLASGTGADALTEANAGATVYVVDEQTVGATSASGTRPVAGVMLPIDPTVPTGLVPVKMANPAS